MKKQVLVVVSALSNFRAMAPLAQRLHGLGYAVGYLIDPGAGAIAPQVRSSAQSLSAPVFVHDELPVVEADITRYKAAWTRFKGLRRSSVYGFFLAHLDINARFLVQAEGLIGTFAPDIVLVPEDGISGNTWMITAAKKAGVAVLTCPYGFGGKKDLEDALARKHKDGELVQVNGLMGWIVWCFFNKWVKKGRFAGAVIFPLAIILAREVLGLSLNDPWCVNGGMSDAIAAESEAMLAHYLSEGIAREKCILTGSVYADIVSDALVANASRTRTDKRRILVSWPTSYHASHAATCEFSSYEDMTLAILGALCAQPNFDVDVSLHPAASDDVKRIIQEGGATLTDEFVVSAMAWHDVFISCFSSTTRWAVALGQPVINYDFYGFDLPEYGDCPGVVKVDSFASFCETIAALSSDSAYYEALVEAQKSVAARWGMLDGQNVTRIADTMELLIKRAQKGR